MAIRGFLSVVIGCCFLSSALALPVPERLAEQRAGFLEARSALYRGDWQSAERLSAKLTDYSLYPYLRFEHVNRRLSRASAEEVHEFIDVYHNTPLAARLHRSWLYTLARQGRWEQFVSDYDGSGGTELRCYDVRARLELKQYYGLWDDIESLWMVGVSQPDACDPAFAAWRERGFMTREKLLQRIGLAMESGQTGLVGYLSRGLADKDRRWVGEWQSLAQAPESGLKKLLQSGESERDALLFSYAVRRLAKQNADKAEQYLHQGERFALSADQLQHVKRVIALSLAHQRHPSAPARLAELPATDDADVRHWRVRSALWQQDWPEVLRAFDALSAEERRDPDWAYWRARALDALGRDDEAMAEFATAANCRCYYGFLAADFLGRAPRIQSKPLAVAETDLQEFASLPGVVRAKELYELKLVLDARREWREVVLALPGEELATAAKLADSWGWHDQAILTLGRSEFLHDLELRFPLPFESAVASAAERRDLDPAFVYALMRQESAFYPRARSPVGALGLMQLMPATARMTARQLQRPDPKTSDLLTVESNVELGTAHLRYLMDIYGDNRLYTMAAYNAGPHRVSRWRPKDENLPADIWVANVPFRETRDYLQRIVAYTRIYEWRMGRALTSLSWLQSGLDKVGVVADPHQARTAMADGAL